MRVIRNIWPMAQMASLLIVSAMADDPTTPIGGLSGLHTDIPRWCGKPYQPGGPDYNPGGQVYAPKPSFNPKLNVQLQPRHSIYDSSESTAEFIVDAPLSYIHGQYYTNSTTEPESVQKAPFTTLAFDIRIEGNDHLLASETVPVNSTGNLIMFDITSLKPRLNPYKVVLFGTPVHSNEGQTYTAETELYYLPAKNTGSSVKIDNLHGGMLVANNASKFQYEPLLPFGFYTSCSGYLNYSLANVSAYKDMGFTAINPVCSYQDGDLGYLFDWMDQSNLWYQYDMRGLYLNLSQVEANVPLIKDRSNFLSWYTADEPDGWQYALNSTTLAYDLLKKMDPYHPTGLVLNCDNYYFKQYTAGTDYIMEDAYPIGVNATYSRPWKTVCNATYGDCGCDDCVGDLQDVSNRLDAFRDYQTWLDLPQKPLWAVLQAFSGEGYWARDPTPEETWVMMVISLNHGAKGIMSWLFPSTETLNIAHAEMALVATSSEITAFLLGAEPRQIQIPHYQSIDVAYWIKGKQALIGFANLDSEASTTTVSVCLPVKIGALASQPWGSVEWVVRDGELFVESPKGLATSFIIVDLV
ncbi:Hypothetical protein R9X50_00282300 [Acrodontium crateriforme]|uniref:Uncharacterized protein n=1 Tax=Acrodontium crateriforme TaxID=150365 RepID=A0AAQ3R9E1_9PEZI|nr:Hypothetical protein R9X50_00282300 [Acrodontium crateriforme]